MQAHIAGGGEATLSQAESFYYVKGPLFVVSNVGIDLNGQILVGDNFNTGTMFETGVLRKGKFERNSEKLDEDNLISNSSVRNGQIRKCALAFDLTNFTVGCSIKNDSTFEALQFGQFRSCFYMAMRECSARGPSRSDSPAFAFLGQNNLLGLLRVSATSESDFYFQEAQLQ